MYQTGTSQSDFVLGWHGQTNTLIMGLVKSTNKTMWTVPSNGRKFSRCAICSFNHILHTYIYRDIVGQTVLKTCEKHQCYVGLLICFPTLHEDYTQLLQASSFLIIPVGHVQLSNCSLRKNPQYIKYFLLLNIVFTLYAKTILGTNILGILH